MGRGFKSAANRFEFRFERKLQNRPRSSRDRPRSTRIDHDRASIVLQILRNCCSTVVESIPQQMECDCGSSRRDRGSIGPRSWGSSTIRRSRRISDYRDEDPALTSLHVASGKPSDEALIVMKIQRAREFHAASLETVRSRSRDLQLMKIGRSQRVHVAKGKPCDHFT